MQTVFEVIVFENNDDVYEPNFEGSLGLAGTLAQAVAYIAIAKDDPEQALEVESEDGLCGVIIRERMLGRFTGEVADDTVATYDWRGQLLEGQPSLLERSVPQGRSCVGSEQCVVCF